MRIFDRQEQVDASRQDPNAEPVRSVAMSLVKPVTANGSRYPQTLCVEIPEGRLPEWLKPYFTSGQLRRIQTRNDPGFGFVTPTYTAKCAGPRAYVARQPGDGPHLRRSIIRAAEQAGWTIDNWGSAPLLQTDLYA